MNLYILQNELVKTEVIKKKRYVKKPLPKGLKIAAKSGDLNLIWRYTNPTLSVFLVSVLSSLKGEGEISAFGNLKS